MFVIGIKPEFNTVTLASRFTVNFPIELSKTVLFNSSLIKYVKLESLLWGKVCIGSSINSSPLGSMFKILYVSE